MHWPLLLSFPLFPPPRADQSFRVIGSPGDTHQSPVKIKRRKHPSLSDSTSAKNQLFYFVDSNSSSREKRAHVMRHHVQEKRRQRKHSHPRRDHDKVLGRSLHYFPWQQKTLDLEDEDFDFNDPIEPRESPDRIESVADDKSLVCKTVGVL